MFKEKFQLTEKDQALRARQRLLHEHSLTHSHSLSVRTFELRKENGAKTRAFLPHWVYDLVNL
jgi:hypothetical protein